MDKVKFSGIVAGAGKSFFAIVTAVMLIGAVSAFAAAYDITFNANGGYINSGSTAATAKITTAADGTIAAASWPTPVWTNHKFSGWYTAASGGTLLETNKVFTANTTIYAQWTTSVTVTFNPVGGSVTPASAATDLDGKLTSLPAPTYAGYTFDGWYTAEKNGTLITEANVFTTATTIFAHWTIINYTITFSPKGAGPKETDLTGAGWKLATLSPPSAKNYYTVDGWYTEEIGGEKVTTSTVFKANTTIYARFTPISYTITYGGMTGATVMPANPASYTIETEDITLTNPTKPAHTFTGWTGTGITGTTPELTVSIPQGSTGARTYTANWTVNISTITFSATYDAIDTSFTRETGNTSANAGKVANLPTLPTRTGYTFDGWYPDDPDGAKVTTGTVFDGDATVYARWTPVSYTISYNNMSGGIADPVNPTKYTIETPAFSLNEPTRVAYTFDGWTWTGNTTPEKDVSIEAGSTGNKSYTANWTAVFYKITFDAGDGDVKPDTANTIAGGKLASLPTPTLAGYFFEGWLTDEMIGVKVTTNTVFGDNTTVYAQWTPIYTVTFNANGGGSLSFITAKTGSGGKLDSLPKAVKAGQALDGWYTDSISGAAVTKNTAFIENTTVYARWTAGNAVTFSAGANGKLTATVGGNDIASGEMVAKGKSVVFTAIPDEGYEVSGWTVNSVADTVNKTKTYTLASLTADTAVTVSFKKLTAVASPDRVIPAGSDGVTAAVAPAAAQAAEFTAGPNPVGRSAGSVSFFRSGSRIESAALTVYDAAGNKIAAVKIGKNADAGGNAKRAVGSWDLRDKKGRPAPEGTYLIKGTIKTAGGKREQVSVILNVGR